MKREYFILGFDTPALLCQHNGFNEHGECFIVINGGWEGRIDKDGKHWVEGGMGQWRTIEHPPRELWRGMLDERVADDYNEVLHRFREGLLRRTPIQRFFNQMATHPRAHRFKRSLRALRASTQAFRDTYNRQMNHQRKTREEMYDDEIPF